MTDNDLIALVGRQTIQITALIKALEEANEKLKKCCPEKPLRPQDAPMATPCEE